MKKISKLMMIMTLTAAFALFGAMPALAASTADINTEDVKYSKIDISDIELSNSKRSYTVSIEKGALEAAVSQGKNFRITMDNVTLSFPGSVFYTDAYKKAVAMNRPVEIRLNVKTEQGFDMGKYLTSGLNNNFQLATQVTELQAELYVSGSKSSDMNQLAAPISFVLDYKEIWNSSYTGKAETGVTMAWYDSKRKMSSAPKWTRLTTRLDTKNHVATAQNVYSCGVIAPIICPDLNNVSGTSSGSQGGNGSIGTVGGIDAHWAADGIRAMQQAGIVPSDVAVSKLNQPITRDEFAAYLVRTMGLQKDTTMAGKFSDVSENNPYYDDIYTGVKEGLISGSTAGTFSPNNKITRQEMAVFFARALEKKGYNMNSTVTKLAAMKDYKQIPNWSIISCAVAVNSGIITGEGAANGSKIFAPYANATWAEAVVMLERLRTGVYDAPSPRSLGGGA